MTASNIAGQATSSRAALSIIVSSDSAINNTANANIIVPDLPPAINGLIKNEGGVTLTGTGTANAVYILQASPDCINWTDVSTNTAGASGQWQATEITDAPSRFYRIELVIP